MQVLSAGQLQALDSFDPALPTSRGWRPGAERPELPVVDGLEEADPDAAPPTPATAGPALPPVAESTGELMPGPDALLAFVTIAGGSEPFPRTPAAWEALTVTSKLALRQGFPALAEHFESSPTLLPAAVEARLGQAQETGDLSILRDDVDALSAAGYGSVVQQIRAESRAATHAAWASGKAARAAAEAEAAPRRAAEAQAAREALATAERRRALQAHIAGRGGLEMARW